VSVSDKTGLEAFIPRLLEINPALRIFSTGGTFDRVRQILGARADGVLTQVSDYTGQPETQGGLVKTLDFKIYLGLLTETYNPAHRADLARTGAVAIDMAVVNLYPFQQTVAAVGTTVEQARGHIDIGGPCMIRAAAKNFIRVASVVDPADYPMLLDALSANGGATSLALRLALAKKAFAHTARYDQAIAAYLEPRTIEEVDACYPVND
jgi:phosphoribosylaminoimidazolecarboxamide formyltransferase/IMP cyclohydrolase